MGHSSYDGSIEIKMNVISSVKGPQGLAVWKTGHLSKIFDQISRFIRFLSHFSLPALLRVTMTIKFQGYTVGM
jgi:hypothetical protein